MNFIIGFRESLEAILLIFVLIKIVTNNNKKNQVRSIYLGAISGIILSIAIVIIINMVESYFATYGGLILKIWEVSSSLISALLIILLINYLLKYKNNFQNDLKIKTNNKSEIGVFLLSMLMVSREGFEIVLFTLGSNTEYSNLMVLFGIMTGIILGLLINYSILKISLKKLFNLLTIYLILQAGYLMGYAVHEFIEILELKNILINSNILYGRLFNLSGTILDSKSSILGIILNSVLGWYSKPHILQFIMQYIVTIYLLYRYTKYSNN